MSSATDPLFDEEDLSNPDFRCVHGNFIGNPYGGDYMCGLCEDGVTIEEYELMCMREGNAARRRNTAVTYIEACPSDFKYDFHPVIGQMIMALYLSMYQGPKKERSTHVSTD